MNQEVKGVLHGLFLIILLGLNNQCFAGRNLRIASWNIANFGASKSETELEYIAGKLVSFDLVALQEISTGEVGVKQVQKLASILSLKGVAWAYTVSEPTNGPGTERYAFLWKKENVKLTEAAFLIKSLDKQFDREPFAGRFENGKERFLLVNFHAVPKSKEPWKECRHLYLIDSLYQKDNLLLVGDFNLSQENYAFYKLKKRGIIPVFINQLTTIKMEPNKQGQKLANAYDNVFYEKDAFKIQKSGIVPFYEDFQELKDCRKISDHVPVWVEIR